MHVDTQSLMQIARKAGRAILDVYYTEFEVTHKADQSPLTVADEAANDIIISELSSLYPDIPIISEETAETTYSTRRKWPYVWLVDPLDGTKEFVQRNGEFTVNIALVAKGEPVWGMIHVPVSGATYHASIGSGAFRSDNNNETESIASTSPDKKLVIASSRSHVSPEVEKYVLQLRAHFDRVEFISAGSALKFCLIAEGRAHLYPRFGTTMEWDTAAGQVITREAGGSTIAMSTKESLEYNKENLKNPSFVVMGSDLTAYLPSL